MSQRAESTQRKPRRFLPEPFETSSRSSKKRQNHETLPKTASSAQSASSGSELDDNSSIIAQNEFTDFGQPPSPWRIGGSASAALYNSAPDSKTTETMHHTTRPLGAGLEQHEKRKRFTPQLMETARHSFRPVRNSLDNFAGPQAQRSQDTTDELNRMEMDDGPSFESPFSYSSLLRRHEPRRHSFRVPDLPAIPSSESEGSNEPYSPEQIASPSATKSDSCSDDREDTSDGQETTLAEYNVSFPLHPSKSQLQDRALAAFPNEQVYQPVDHFAIDMGEEEVSRNNDSATYDRRLAFRVNRRASSADLPSELEYLRKHKEEAGMNRRHYLTTKGGHVSHVVRQSSRSASGFPNEDRDRNHPLTPLRPAASPPMLGDDLAFPQSLTPQSTICEGFYGEHPREDSRDPLSFAGLWNGSSTSPNRYDRGGLWNGTCKPDRNNTEQSEALLPGLITPRHDVEKMAPVALDESVRCRTSDLERSHLIPRSSTSKGDSSDNIDQDEFNDSFVTQIYDYLSLGYPSIARYYDYELSKVSGLSITALRADDSNIEAKGHLGGHDIARGDKENGCMRWVALRLYIREWARQHPKMLETGRYHEAWGVRERKGSWAV